MRMLPSMSVTIFYIFVGKFGQIGRQKMLLFQMISYTKISSCRALNYLLQVTICIFCIQIREDQETGGIAE